MGGDVEGCVTLRTVAMGMGEALVTAVDTVVDTVADVRHVDALAARQTVERAVAGRTRWAGHRRPAGPVVRTAASASGAAASGSHRASPAGRHRVTVGRRLSSISV